MSANDKEMRLLRDYKSVKEYFGRLGVRLDDRKLTDEERQTERRKAEYIAAKDGIPYEPPKMWGHWRGNYRVVIFKPGQDYSIEVGELEFRTDFRQESPFKEGGKLDPVDRLTWVLKPTEFSMEHPMTEAENQMFKAEALRYRAPEPTKVVIEGAGKGPLLSVRPNRSLLGFELLPDLIANADPEDVYTYWDFEDEIIADEYPAKLVECIRVRYRRSNGVKRFMTFTPHEGGEWVLGEPEDFHRIYGIGELRASKAKKRLFVHEGEKAVEHIRRGMVTQEPLNAFLCRSDAFHVGWGFGAPGARRVDWRLLSDTAIKAGVEEIVFVPDADQEGLRAVFSASEGMAGTRLEVFMFDTMKIDKVPKGWDFADPMPKANYVKDHEGKLVWAREDLEAFLKPAFWVTHQVGFRDGRPIFDLTNRFIDDCYMVSGNKTMFVRKSDPLRVFFTNTLNDAVRNFSHLAEVAPKLKAQRLQTMGGLAFRPGKSVGPFYDDDGRDWKFNQYKDLRPTPQQGDVGVLIEFIYWLVPDADERRELIRWIATVLAKPEQKMQYALLLFSVKGGVGKSLLLSVLRSFLGGVYVAEISDRALLESDFNGAMHNALLVICHEIYAEDNYKAVDKLKTIITEEKIQINEKYGAQFETDNAASLAGATNKVGALALTGDDRRWLVVHCREQTLPRNMLRDVLAFRDGGVGLRNLRWWLENSYEAEGYTFVEPGEHAPLTETKKEFIEMSVAAWSQHLLDALGGLKLKVNEDTGEVLFGEVVMAKELFVSMERAGLLDKKIGDKARFEAVRKGGFFSPMKNKQPQVSYLHNEQYGTVLFPWEQEPDRDYQGWTSHKKERMAFISRSEALSVTFSDMQLLIAEGKLKVVRANELLRRGLFLIERSPSFIDDDRANW
ncbi:primase-helicase family protein [Ruegeria marina]|uniref:Virulence-associated protein E n=1 Tax=Ruegeria marina TaxID=639004 RepID=A0A1G6LH81_9RHOB|nr:DUF5906 domain-containing protein [Ruegeria marina]SDC42591.1 Virulence-associated protein E [Ruegeria marina]